MRLRKFDSFARVYSGECQGAGCRDLEMVLTERLSQTLSCEGNFTVVKCHSIQKL